MVVGVYIADTTCKLLSDIAFLEGCTQQVRAGPLLLLAGGVVVHCVRAMAQAACRRRGGVPCPLSRRGGGV